jgi:hypothetical protein
VTYDLTVSVTHSRLVSLLLQVTEQFRFIADNTSGLHWASSQILKWTVDHGKHNDSWRGRWYNNNNDNNNNEIPMHVNSSQTAWCRTRRRRMAFKVLGLFWVIGGFVLFELYVARFFALPPPSSSSSSSLSTTNSLTLTMMDLHPQSSSVTTSSLSSSFRKSAVAAAKDDDYKKGVVGIVPTWETTRTQTKPPRAAIAAATQQQPQQQQEEEEDQDVTTNNKNNNKVCRCVRCNIDKKCGHLWVGGVLPSQGNPHVFERIRLVVSHCLHDLAWMEEFIQGFESVIVELVIYSKCGQKVAGIPRRLMAQAKNKRHPNTTTTTTSTTTTTVSIRRLPNVGRCDHGHAYYLARYNTTTDDDDDEDTTDDPSSSSSSSSSLLPSKREVLVFLKDEREEQTIHQPGRWRSLSEMLQIASTDTGFGCGMELRHARDLHARPQDPFHFVSAYHNTSTLARFSMQQDYHSQSGQGAQGVAKYVGLVTDPQLQNPQVATPPFMSNFVNLGDFVTSLPGVVVLPTTTTTTTTSAPHSSRLLTQVCYGGTFAVTQYQIRHQTSPVTFAALEQRLSRGDNIEEGHFTERYWAALLAKPLPDYQTDALLQFSTSTAEWHDYLYGTLTHPKPSRTSQQQQQQQKKKKKKKGRAAK